HLTLAHLFFRRAQEHGAKTLFEVPGPGPARSVSWRQAASRVDALARGLAALAQGEAARVAIFSENRLEMALCDLACHAAGLVSILIPAIASEGDAAYMLRHAQPVIVVAGSRETLAAVRRAAESVASLRTIVAMDAALAGPGVLALDEVAARAGALA